MAHSKAPLRPDRLRNLPAVSEQPESVPEVGRPRDGLKHRLARWVARRFFEPEGLIETSTVVKLDEVGLDSDERVGYWPTPRFVVPLVLRRLRVRRDDVFLDFGSGKGRVARQAARFPFKRVIGVELAEDFNRIARHNIEVSRDRLKCNDVQLVTADVVTYEIPDDVTIAYFFHPFEGEIFARVVENLVASLDRNPRDLRIVYVLPMMADLILETGRFEVERRMRAPHPPALRNWYEVLIFRNKPADRLDEGRAHAREHEGL